MSTHSDARGRDSARKEREVWELDLPPRALLVICAMKDRLEENDGWVRMDWGALAHYTSLSLVAVRRAVWLLAKRGILLPRIRRGRNWPGRRWKLNLAAAPVKLPLEARGLYIPQIRTRWRAKFTDPELLGKGLRIAAEYRASQPQPRPTTSIRVEETAGGYGYEAYRDEPFDVLDMRARGTGPERAGAPAGAVPTSPRDRRWWRERILDALQAERFRWSSGCMCP